MSVQIPTLIDNETFLLRDAVREYAKHSREVKIATGYLRVSGFDLVKEELKNLRPPSITDGVLDSPFKIIMGRDVDEPTAEQLAEGYKKRIQEEMGKLDLDKLSKLYEFIQSGYLDVRIMTDKRFHSKTYIFRDLTDYPIPNITIVGSSNFTYQGQAENIELNEVDKNGFTVEPLEKWFEKHWQASQEFNEDLLKIIESDGRFSHIAATQLPYIYLKPDEFVRYLILALGKEYLVSGEEEKILLQFQIADYKQCLTTIRSYGGAINASSVGLGKSFVACQTIKHYLANGKRVLLIAPPHLLVQDQWLGYLRRFGISIRDITTLSMYDLSRDDFEASKYYNYDLIVVDEVHNFRNSDRIRHQNLRKLRSINTEFLLLSATPINNSPEDLKNIIDIFLDEARFRGGRQDLLKPYFGLVKYSRASKKYRKEGGIDKSLFKILQDSVQDLRKHLVIRTTRKDLRNSYGETMKLEGRTVKFFEPNLTSFNYELRGPEYRELFNKIIQFIDELELAHVTLLNPKAGRYLTAIYKHLLYKRLESSIYSFHASIENLRQALLRFQRLLDTHSIAQLREKTKEELRTELRHIVADDRTISEFIELGKAPSETEKANYLASIKRDLDRATNFMKIVEKLRVDNFHFRDDKIELLKAKLKADPRKKILFTQFIDTAEYLYENLKEDKNLGKIRLVTGDVKDKQPRIDAFKTDSGCKILISTDVLSEGTNIPEADVVVNYDLPWNPVKLIQRVGRVDRIGVNKQIDVWNFNPDKNIDSEIELMRRLKVKIRDIIQIIGTEYAVLSPEEVELIRSKERDDIELFEEKRQLIMGTKWDELEGPSEAKHLDEIDQLLLTSIGKYGIKLESLGQVTRMPDGKIPFTRLTADEPGTLVFERLRMGAPPNTQEQDTWSIVPAQEGKAPKFTSIEFEEKPGRLTVIERSIIDQLKSQVEDRKQQLLQERLTNIGAQRDVERIKGSIETRVSDAIATRGLTDQRRVRAEKLKQLLAEFTAREIPSSYLRRLQAFRREWMVNGKRIMTDDFIREFEALVEELKRTAQAIARPETSTLQIRGLISLVNQ